MTGAGPRSGSSDNRMSGTVNGNLLQAAEVHGDVYLAGPTPSRTPPYQLPRPPRHLAGRERELGELDALLGTVDAVVLRGPGGVGRSALAAFWLRAVAGKFPGGVLHAELTHPGGEPLPAEDVLGRFLRALGVPADEVPATLAERTALFRSTTALEPVAVLLDDAVSAAQARVLLPAAPGSLAMITTSQPLLGLVASGAAVVAVGPLADAGALELLSGHLGAERVAAERGAAEEVVALCGGLPIALCVAAALIRARTRRTIAWMADRLRDARGRLDVLSGEDDCSVRATFDLAYRDLPDRAKAVYRVMGVHPGALVPAELAAAAVDLPVEDVAEALDDLVEACLADEVDRGWYQLHGLAHVHASSVPAEDAKRARTARALVDWYRDAVRRAGDLVLPARRHGPPPPRAASDPAGALDWLDRVRGDLGPVLRLALAHGLHHHVIDMCDALKGFFIVRKHYVEAIEVYELTLVAALATDDLTAEIGVRRRLARAFSRLGRAADAEGQVRAMIASAQAHDDRRAVAKAHESLGLLHRDQGRTEAAVEQLEISLAMVRTQDRPRGEALLLLELGIVLTEVDVDAALARLVAARAALIVLATPDEYNAARADLAEGRIRLHRGEVQQAGVLLHRALAALTAHGATREAANAHLALADWATRAADPDAARWHAGVGADLLGGPGRAG
ncbi:NB-ARC domain-containing protein [Actinokineospora spheciospongiae]|nr:NB-ARC domain-containing protein [Actinokineospora spheciospongiae]